MPKILLVEDNKMNRDILVRRLERRGYQMVIAANGNQALSLVQTEAPDLILMDMRLPLLDGWETTKRMKADDKTRHIPIIAITAHAMSGDREKAMEAGCDEYETKPINFNQLLEKIAKLLRKENIS